MHIAIDASRTTVARITGTERYSLEIIRAMIAQNPGHEVTLYFRDAPPGDLFQEVKHCIIPFKRAWTHLRFASAIWQHKPDITFVPSHTLPFMFPGKALVTVHDLGFKHFPEAHPLRSRLYLDWTTRYSATRATQVLADSQATADDLHHFYGINQDKIHVVYPGVVAPIINDVDVRTRYNLSEQFFLFIGTLQPRKNIARIVQAYAQYRQSTTSPVDLVLAGGKGWLFDEAWVTGVDGLHLPGYIDEADKGKLLSEAIALVFPTLYEGFGFPVVEAMHCGTPIIASNTSSLPELVGDAGLLVNPLQTDEITQAMLKITSDDNQQMIQRGYTQAKQFTWDKAAKQVWEIISRIR